MNRAHLADERSALFYDLQRVLGWIEEIARDMGIWRLNFVENVVADSNDVKTTCREALGIRPIKCCSSHLSRVRRPRLFWSSVKIRDHPCYSTAQRDLYDEVIFEAPVEPMESIPDKGWRWKAGEKDESLRLPTFTRAMPRKRPPPAPAGIDQCNEATKTLWRNDKMKFPPYTYGPLYLFESRSLPGKKRVASATEREKLMGFRPGHTLAMFKKDAETEEEREQHEVGRQAAIGNSFHAVCVACLLDVWLWSSGVKTDLVGPKEIAKRARKELLEAHLGPEDASSLPAMSEAEAGSEEDEEVALQRFHQHGKRAEWMRLAADSNLGIADPKLLSIRLVHQYLRRMEFRGSDIRLDLQVAYRADAVARTSLDPRRWVWEVGQSYPWRYKRRINFFELQAILRTLEWRSRSSACHSCRMLHLTDSQICIAVLTKGKSSSRQVNRILRRIFALCLANNWYMLWGWVASRLNPADEPSRRYAA